MNWIFLRMGVSSPYWEDLNIINIILKAMQRTPEKWNRSKGQGALEIEYKGQTLKHLGSGINRLADGWEMEVGSLWSVQGFWHEFPTDHGAIIWDGNTKEQLVNLCGK